MARNGVIVMTALPVTLGHKFLIDFALKYLEPTKGALQVLMYSRSFEPVSGIERFNALSKHYHQQIRLGSIVFIHVADDDVPQNPSEDPVDFWGNWKARIRALTINKKGDYLFASEIYGIKLAEVLDCEYIPCNIHRDVVQISGTKVRKDPFTNFAEILPEMQHYFRRVVTLFGQESCGKTTMSRRLAQSLNGVMVPEWAREYLETRDAEVTEQKLSTIVKGQLANQLTVYDMFNKPFIFQDTDLLSTLGYYKFWQGNYPDELAELVNATKSDLYFVMNDAIPFEADPLRYGGDKRETTRQYWIDLLKEFGFEYHVVESIDLVEQEKEISEICLDSFNTHANMASFIRT